MTDFETLTFTQSGPITSIVLNRPDAANGMNDTLTPRVRRCGGTVRHRRDEGRHDHRHRPILLRGRRPQGHGRSPDAAAFVKGIADDLHRALSTFARMDAVVITAVNGTAAGAGFSLAVTGDLVLSAESAKFTMAYTKAGLSPDGSSSYYLPRLIGIRRTQQLMLTNRTLSAAEALDWGMFTEVVPDAELAARTEALAKEMAGTSRTSNSTVKRLLLGTYRTGLEEQMELEAGTSPTAHGPPTGRRASPPSWASARRNSAS